VGVRLPVFWDCGFESEKREKEKEKKKKKKEKKRKNKEKKKEKEKNPVGACIYLSCECCLVLW
jgi:sterol desaturase/sphingolipid hydroxylase (fatty acid hydroxylase superfamily)